MRIKSRFVALMILVTLSLPLAAGLNISSLTISTTNNSATISWSTDVPTVYNLTLDITPITYPDPYNLTFSEENSTTHSRTIYGLNENTTYYYLIVCRSGEEYANESGSFVTQMSLPPAAKPFNLNDYLFLLIIAVIAICAAVLVSLNRGIKLIVEQSKMHRNESKEYYNAIIRAIKVIGGKDVSGGEGVRSGEVTRYENEREKYLGLAKERAEDLCDTTRRLKGIDRYGLTEDIVKILKEEIEKMLKSEKAEYSGTPDFREYHTAIGMERIVERVDEQIKLKLEEIERTPPVDAEKMAMEEIERVEREFSEMKRTVEDNYMKYHPDIPRHFLSLAREEIEFAKQMFDKGDYKRAMDKAESARNLVSQVRGLYDVREHRMLLETLKTLVPSDRKK